MNFVATVTKDLIPKGIHAGNIIKEVAKKLVVAVVVALIWLRLEVSYQRKPKKALDLVKELVENQLQ